jgi:hypothetical protein
VELLPLLAWNPPKERLPLLCEPPKEREPPPPKEWEPPPPPSDLAIINPPFHVKTSRFHFTRFHRPGKGVISYFLIYCFFFGGFLV